MTKVEKIVAEGSLVVVGDWTDKDKVLAVKYASHDIDTVKSQNGQTYYTSFCYPLSCLKEILDIVKVRTDLKKAFDDSDKLIYQFNNKIARGE